MNIILKILISFAFISLKVSHICVAKQAAYKMHMDGFDFYVSIHGDTSFTLSVAENGTDRPFALAYPICKLPCSIVGTELKVYDVNSNWILDMNIDSQRAIAKDGFTFMKGVPFLRTLDIPYLGNDSMKLVLCEKYKERKYSLKYFVDTVAYSNNPFYASKGERGLNIRFDNGRFILFWNDFSIIAGEYRKSKGQIFIRNTYNNIWYIVDICNGYLLPKYFLFRKEDCCFFNPMIKSNKSN